MNREIRKWNPKKSASTPTEREKNTKPRNGNKNRTTIPTSLKNTRY